MGHKIPYLSSLLVTCHLSSRLYGVIYFIPLYSMILTVSSFAFCFVKKRLAHNQSRSVPKTSLNASLRHGFSELRFCGRVPWLYQYWPGGFMLFVVLCPGIPEGSTGSRSGFLKIVSEDGATA